MVGIFGAVLEALLCSPREGAKRHYQTQQDLIPYKAYVYIDIYCNQNETINCNLLFEENILITWCYGVLIRTCIQ